MGSSKKQTVGYRYRMGLHMGLCHEPDALLEIAAGDRTAWAGEVTESGTIAINAPNLFGGDEREGGIQGTCDVMMGRPDQLPNAYLTAQQGTPQPAYRGFLGLVYRGLIASNNPYIKNWAVRVRNILRGWHGGDAWYPETAPVPIGLGGAALELSPASEGWSYLVVPSASTADYSADDFDDSAWAVSASPFASQDGHPYTAGAGYPPNRGTTWPINTHLWVRRQFTLNKPITFRMEVFVDNFATVWVNGHLVLPRVGSTTTPGLEVFWHQFDVPAGILRSGANTIALKAEDTGIQSYAAFRIVGTQRQAMNPAHIIYQALTDPDWGMGYPAATIDTASFTVAADALFGEGLGLCLKWNTQTTIQEFTQVVADHASLVYGQDRRTGLFRMRLLRNDYTEAELPVFTRHDLKVISYQRPSLADTVNEVIIEYVDAATGKDATTAPLQNLANIQGQGRVVSQTLSFPGIPTHDLAVRVGMRELQARSTPLWRFSIEAKRKFANLLPGEPFVLDLLDTDLGVRLVMRAGEIDYGEPADGVVRASLVEDVFAMPTTTYVGNPGAGGEIPDTSPKVGPSTAFEVPYTELVQTMGAAELEALAPDVGFVGAVALRPAGVPLNYGLFTRMGAADFEDTATGDYAPGGTLAEPAPNEPGPTVLKLASASGLDQLAIGSGAFLGTGPGAETVRIDAVDVGALEVTVGRGAGDTVPSEWPAGTRLWGFDVEATGDPQQYIDGETIDAKVVNRSNSGQVDLDDAPTHSVTIGSRQARPYAPGWVLVNGQTFPPATVIGDVELGWTHRDRLLQADTLVDTSEASVGPEPGTTYTARFILNGTLVHTESGIVGTTVTWTPIGGGLLRVEVEAERDGLASWHMHVREMTIGQPLLAEDGELFTTEDDAPILME